MKKPNCEAVYIFDERLAERLRNMVYNFQATIHELLARTRMEPSEQTDVGFEETGFWEAHATLRQWLNEDGDELF